MNILCRFFTHLLQGYSLLKVASSIVLRSINHMNFNWNSNQFDSGNHNGTFILQDTFASSLFGHVSIKRDRNLTLDTWCCAVFPLCHQYRWLNEDQSIWRCLPGLSNTTGIWSLYSSDEGLTLPWTHRLICSQILSMISWQHLWFVLYTPPFNFSTIPFKVWTWCNFVWLRRPFTVAILVVWPMNRRINVSGWHLAHHL